MRLIPIQFLSRFFINLSALRVNRYEVDDYSFCIRLHSPTFLYEASC
jgi:hypothetical protein